MVKWAELSLQADARTAVVGLDLDHQDVQKGDLLLCISVGYRGENVSLEHYNWLYSDRLDTKFSYIEPSAEGKYISPEFHSEHPFDVVTLSLVPWSRRARQRPQLLGGVASGWFQVSSATLHGLGHGMDVATLTGFKLEAKEA